MVNETLDIVMVARLCAKRLHELGYDSWGKQITDAIDTASTGGELVMALRWQLQSLQRENFALPPEVDLQISSILQAIEATGW